MTPWLWDIPSIEEDQRRPIQSLERRWRQVNEVLKTIQGRTSLRRYKDVPIKEEDLELLLYAAQRAPTAGNLMLYSILLIRDQHTKEVLSKTCDHQPFIAKAPLVMVFLADVQRWYDYYRISNVEEYCRRTGMEYREPNLSDLFISVSDALIATRMWSLLPRVWV